MSFRGKTGNLDVEINERKEEDSDQDEAGIWMEMLVRAFLNKKEEESDR